MSLMVYYVSAHYLYQRWYKIIKYIYNSIILFYTKNIFCLLYCYLDYVCKISHPPHKTSTVRLYSGTGMLQSMQI